jgi:hypothetical protein
VVAAVVAVAAVEPVVLVLDNMVAAVAKVEMVV